MCSNPTKACAECPFRKNVTPGNLGGSPVDVYLGQLVGPFHIPCHMHIDYSNKNWKDKAFEYPQCAGAGQLRTAMGFDKMLPNIISCPPKTEEVFDSIAEFHHHHTGCTYEESVAATTEDKLFEALMQEMERSGIKIMTKDGE